MPLNLPILLTWMRIVAIPLLVAVYYLPAGWFDPGQRNLAATLIFMAAAVTDWADGYLEDKEVKNNKKQKREQRKRIRKNKKRQMRKGRKKKRKQKKLQRKKKKRKNQKKEKKDKRKKLK
eukprot:TRINITY_DN2640_c0_g3_i1.p4 TRINITY_DN2640_c0_g3~~TRINITY_DN2640_c0_g3_i1.p4  ORF type:complete len:120 (-),score=23.70 TRINITY_DN2640_c0_g3_i1:39-398(-)